MAGDTIGNRMKQYEDVSRVYLTRRSPVIIRIDGRAFHTFTKGFAKPFDKVLMKSMQQTAQYLCENISGCKLAYTQSDEISLLLVDYDDIKKQAWFDNNLQKIVSIAASLATLAFNRFFLTNYTIFSHSLSNIDCSIEERQQLELIRIAYSNASQQGATFDARAFILPKEEVVNYFIWRQQDATRNSILSFAQKFYSQKEIQGIKCDALQNKIFTELGINWNDLPVQEKRGVCVTREEVELASVVRHKWLINADIPIFTQHKEFIERFVFPVGEIE